MQCTIIFFNLTLVSCMIEKGCPNSISCKQITLISTFKGPSQYNFAVLPVLMHWSYCSLTLNHQYVVWHPLHTVSQWCSSESLWCLYFMLPWSPMAILCPRKWRQFKPFLEERWGIRYGTQKGEFAGCVIGCGYFVAITLFACSTCTSTECVISARTSRKWEHCLPYTR